MTRLNLEFVPRRASAVSIASLLAATALALALGAWHYSMAGEIAAHALRKASLERTAIRTSPAPDARTKDGDIEQEVRAARRVIGQMTVPWDVLFRQIEIATDESVALLGVQPDPAAGRVTISGEAKNLNAVLEYTRRLEKSGVLRGVVVLGHSMKDDAPAGIVAFSLSAAWQTRS